MNYNQNMNYNIHPLFVHFPIALLFIYSLLKIVPFGKWFGNVAWKHIERVMLFVGVLFAMVASSTGEMAEHLMKGNRTLIHAHSMFADITVFVYGLILVASLAEIFISHYSDVLSKYPVLNNYVIKFSNLFNSRFVSTSLAIIGLIAISVTGLLGGVIVYGVTADPLASFTLKLLGI